MAEYLGLFAIYGFFVAAFLLLIVFPILDLIEDYKSKQRSK